jgi:hypothetical protein
MIVLQPEQTITLSVSTPERDGTPQAWTGALRRRVYPVRKAILSAAINSEGANPVGSVPKSLPSPIFP